MWALKKDDAVIKEMFCVVSVHSNTCTDLVMFKEIHDSNLCHDIKLLFIFLGI